MTAEVEEALRSDAFDAYAGARLTGRVHATYLRGQRIYDGADEVHKTSLGRRLLRQWKHAS